MGTFYTSQIFDMLVYIVKDRSLNVYKLLSDLCSTFGCLILKILKLFRTVENLVVFFLLNTTLAIIFFIS